MDCHEWRRVYRDLMTTTIIPSGSGSWSQVADMPTIRSAHSVNVVDGKIYAIGGFGFGGSNGQKTLPAVEEYDPVTDSWTTRTSMPTARWGHSGSVVNGKIYTIGGSDNITNGITPVEEYDPATDTWTNEISHANRTSLSCFLYGEWQDLCNRRCLSYLRCRHSVWNSRGI